MTNIITRKELIIEAGWSAFVNGTEYLGIKEFPKGGKAFTSLTIITKPTQEELLAELTAQGITQAPAPIPTPTPSTPKK